MSRDVESINFELDYLRPLLDDARALVDGIADAANCLALAAPATLALLPAVMGRDRSPDDLLAVSTACGATMTKLRELMDCATAHGELIGGRVQAVADELEQAR